MRLWLGLLALLIAECLLGGPAHAATQITDIACETSATTGTGTLNLAGAKSGGYLGFAAAGITSGNTVPYTLVNGTGATRKVETGFGVFTDAATDTLTRVANWSSDGSGAELNLSGTSTVCVGGAIAGLLTDVSILDELVADGILTEAEATAAYQPLDSDLTSWAAVARASGFDTFTATPSMANLGSLLTNDASGWTTFGTTPSAANFASLVTDDEFSLADTDLGTWAGVTRASGFDTFTATPSSANLDSLVTDDTGSGALVFGTSPDITISATTETNIEGAVDLADLGDNYVLDVADGTGIDGTASGVGATYTPTFDATELTGTTTFGAGAAVVVAADLESTDDITVGDDLLLPSTGNVINFDDGDCLITHSAETLTLSGCDGVGFAEAGSGDQLGDDADRTDFTVSGGAGAVANIDPDLSIDSTADAVDGIVWTFEHSDPSPDAGDDPFDIVVNAGDDQEKVGGIQLELVDDATTTEDTSWILSIDVAGANVDVLKLESAGATVVGTVDASNDVDAADDVLIGDDINFGGGDVLISYAANDLDFTGVTGDYSFDDSVFVTGVVDASTDVDAGDDLIAADDIQLSAGALIDMGGGDVVITFAANDLDFTGVTGDYSFDDSVFVTGVVDASTDVDAGDDVIVADDIQMTAGGLIDMDGGDVVITFTANDLAFTGVTGDYSFDDTVGITGSMTASVDVTATAGDVTAGDDLVGDDLTLLDDLSVASITSNDAGAVGTVVQLRHDSASAADGDIAADIQVFAGADDEEVGRLALEVDDGGTGSEDTQWRFFTDVAGASAQQMAVGAGVIIGNDTTFPGAGNINVADAKGIFDGGGNEQLLFQETASATNYYEITNAATGNRPNIKSTGSDADVGIWFSVTGSPSNAVLFDIGAANFPSVLFSNTSASTGGPNFGSWHNTASAADNDTVGQYLFSGNNDNASPEFVTYASFYAQSLDVSDNTEDGVVAFQTIVAGASQTQMSLSLGAVVGAGATYPGAGSLALSASATGPALLRLYEDTDNGTNFKAFISATSNTADTTCTFENDANFIPDSCVGDGTDASDERLKTNLVQMTDVGSIIDQIKIYSYTWNATSLVSAQIVEGQPGVGPKAQELFNLLPGVVKVGGVDPITEPWTWKPERMVPYLIVEAQNSRSRLATLEAAGPSGGPTIVNKAADQTKTANTTLANDSVLTFSVAANTKYRFRVVAFFDTTANADLKFALACPASPSLVRVSRSTIIPGATAASNVAVLTACGASTALTGTGTTGGRIELEGTIHNGVNAGTVALQWAQNTSDAGNTIMRAGSYLEYQVVQ